MAELTEEDLVDYDLDGDEPTSMASTVSADIQAEDASGPSTVAEACAPTSANRSATDLGGSDDIRVPRLSEGATDPPSSGVAGMDIQLAEVQGQPERDDRCSRVYVADIRRTFPAPCEYDDLDIRSKSRPTLRLIANAPWFDKPAVQADGEHLRLYANSSGVLPGGIPLGCLKSWTWQRVFCARENDLFVDQDRLPSSIRQDFNLASYQGVSRLSMDDVISLETGVDLFAYRTSGDIPYVRRLLAITAELLNSWKSVVGVRQAAICFDRPLLPMEFRYLTKNTGYWLHQVPDERFARSLWNLAIPFFCPQAWEMTRDARRRGFSKLIEAWERFEVAQGCNCELPTVFSYKTSALMRRESGYWVVAFTEQACKVAAFLLFDVYDSLRLWWVSPTLIAAMRGLDLSFVLGSQANEDELYRLLDVVESVDFTTVDTANSWRYANAWRSVGRDGIGGDFVRYDPWTRRRLTYQEYEAILLRGRRQLPAGHPTGLDYDIHLEGWDGREYSPPLNDKGDADQVADVVQPEVRFLTDEDILQYRPARYARSESCEEVAQVGYPPVPYIAAPYSLAPMMPFPPLVPGYPVMQEVEVIRRFLYEVGLPEDATRGSRSDLISYLRGRLGM